MNKSYNRINWENYPSDKTPVNENNLNKIDGSLDTIDDRVISLDTTKATKTEVAPLIKEISFNESNGIFTITRKNGSKFTIDTKLEKIAVNFTYNPTTQQIILTLIDGTKQYIDLSALITQYEFLDTDTVSFFVDTNGKVSAIVKEGSIEEKHLRPNYLAEIKVEAAKAEASATAADASQKKAKASENAAKASQTAAKASEDAAADSAADAAASEATATQKAADAAASATTATQKATAAGNSASAAATSATNAANSKNAAATSATNAANSASTAGTKASEAADSAAAALTSQNAAKASETKAKTSETNAAASKIAASNSASTASTKADEAATSATNAANSAATATQKATAAGTSATNAANSASTATTKANAASTSATNAAKSATSADTYAKQAQSYAVGTGGVRPNEAIDSAKYYYEQSKGISEGLAGTLQAMGTVSFENLPLLADVGSGWMYNISNEFITDSTFKEGVGHVIPAGSNVYKTADGFWDVLAGAPVSSVNGQTGNVTVNLRNIPGTLPITKGGTGKTTANGALNALTSAASEEHETYAFTDADKILWMYHGATPFTQTYMTSLLKLWNYIQSKLAANAVIGVKGNAESAYRVGQVSLSAENVGAMPYNNSIVNGTDLNTMTDQGFYFKVGGVSIVNGPEGYPVANGLGLAVVRIANTITAQFVFGYSSNTNVKIYFRRGTSASWSDWDTIGSVSENDATYVKKTGDTITGNLTVKGAGMGYYSVSPDNSQSVWFGVASNKSYRGLWDKVLHQYFAALDANNELILGLNTPTRINGIAGFRRSTGQGVYTGTSGTAGWVVIAQIKINLAYVNNTIELEVAGRGRSMIAHLYIMFKSVESHDPDLDVFLCYGQQNSNSIYRLKKTATSTWQLAAEKNEAHGSIYIASVHSELEFFNGGVSITYPNKQLTTAPDSTWIAPTWYGKIGTAVNAENASALSNFILTSSAAISGSDTKWGGIGYAKVDAGTFGPGTNSIVDGALYKQRYSDLWEARIYQDYRTGRLAVKGKKDGTWQPTRLIPIADISENMQLQGTLVLSKATDASGTADNKPALIVGGLSTGVHLELDPNEIMAKANGTTPADLSLNWDGGIVHIGSGGLKSRGNIIATDLYGIYVGSKYYNIIKAFDDGETANNGLQGIVQFGGNVFIGGGEAPTNLYNAYQTASNLKTGEAYDKTGERLYLCADSGMYLLANCNTIANRTGIVIGSADSDYKVFVRPLADLKGILGRLDYYWNLAYLNRIISKLVTSTYLNGNQGNAIINSVAPAGAYVMLARMSTTNGYMTIGIYKKKFLLQYTAKATVDAGTNAVTKSATLLDENGNSAFPGVVTAARFNGSVDYDSKCFKEPTTASDIPDNYTWDDTVIANMIANVSSSPAKTITLATLASVLSAVVNNIKMLGYMCWGNGTKDLTTNAVTDLMTVGIDMAFRANTRLGIGYGLKDIYNNFKTNLRNIVSILTEIRGYKKYTTLANVWSDKNGLSSTNSSKFVTFAITNPSDKPSTLGSGVVYGISFNNLLASKSIMLIFHEFGDMWIHSERGNTWYALYSTPSSIRFKQNVQDLKVDEAYKILNLRPVTFDYKEELGGATDQMGFIAEEIEELFPSAVVRDPEGNINSIKYQMFVAPLVKMAQKHEESLIKQNKEIQELKAENTALRAELAELKAAVQTLLSR